MTYVRIGVSLPPMDSFSDEKVLWTLIYFLALRVTRESHGMVKNQRKTAIDVVADVSRLHVFDL